jgi:hypothetical protein
LAYRATEVIAFVVFVVVFVFVGVVSTMDTCYSKMIIKTATNSICGFHKWNPDLEFVSSFIIITKT